VYLEKKPEGKHDSARTVKAPQKDKKVKKKKIKGDVKEWDRPLGSDGKYQKKNRNNGSPTTKTGLTKRGGGGVAGTKSKDKGGQKTKHNDGGIEGTPRGRKTNQQNAKRKRTFGWEVKAVEKT